MSFFSFFGSGSSNKDRFTLQNLKLLHQSLLDNVTVTAENYEVIVETLRSLSEMVSNLLCNSFPNMYNLTL